MLTWHRAPEYPSSGFADCTTEDEWWDYNAARNRWAEDEALRRAEQDAEDMEFCTEDERESYIDHRAEDLYGQILDET